MSKRRSSIDTGLDKLCKQHPSGACLTFEEIAEACGCHKSNIQQIQESAIKKLRYRRARLTLFREYLHEMIEIQGGVKC